MVPDRLSPWVSLQSSKQFPGRIQKVAEDSDHSSSSGNSTNQRMRLQFLGGAQENVFRIRLSESQAILTETSDRQAAAFLSAFPAKQDASFTSTAHGRDVFSTVTCFV